ncbi:unnamed protein product [Phytophthora fragariaefolia]|uniref:Unnamed protein product n=1 Tax=Phytophthora fragariaefolia TaxID=1490495 RepID=A0A9W6Y4W3_9STRA|nr:unnamed protein product [Phytophthora fragariaefolia]
MLPQNVNGEDNQLIERRQTRAFCSWDTFHLDIIGAAALHTATWQGDSGIVEYLLEEGLDPDVADNAANLDLPDNDSVTPLQLVIHTNDITMLQLMLNHHQLVATHQGEDFAGSVLMTAVDEGALPTVKLLLEEGYVRVDYQNAVGETAMHRALFKCKPEITALLRSLEEPFGWALLGTTSGESCLHYAARYSSSNELGPLLDFYRHWSREESLDAGESNAFAELIRRVDSTTSTPLFVAATSMANSPDDRITKTRLLLDAGGKLLGASPFLVAKSSSSMVLSEEVQQCLGLWSRECAEDSLDDVTRFCLKYLVIVESAHLESSGHYNYEVVNTFVSSVHSADSMPLLLSLPFDCSAVSLLLTLVETLGTQLNHSLLLALHRELVDAWPSRVHRFHSGRKGQYKLNFQEDVSTLL